METCFLNGYGACSDKISREHYISENVLEAISKGNRTVQIGGLCWQSENTLQHIGLGALQSKILCTKHNSELSSLDALAGKLFRVLDAVDKNPESLPETSQFDGVLVELWLLKTLCGLVKSSNITGNILNPICLDILSGSDWPSNWGLYIPIPSESQILNNEFYFETKVNPSTNEILLASFRIAGVPFNIVLGNPDEPRAFGIHHPQGLIFELESEHKRVEFIWPTKNNHAITFKKIGKSSSVPKHHENWKN